MAKKVGSENKAPKLPKSSGAPAAIGDNVTEGSFLSAVQEISKAQAVVKEANTRLKQVRKKWKANGIELGILDATVKMAEWTRGEIRDRFALERQYAEWLGLPTGPKTGEQSDLAPHLYQAQEWRAMGRSAALAGKPCSAPEGIPPENIPDFTAGWHEADEENWADAEPPPREERKPKEAAAKPAEEKKPEPDPAPPGGEPETAEKVVH